VVEQIVISRNFIVNLGFASVDNEFLGVTICSTTLAEVDNEISKGNNLLYHPLSYVLFIYWYVLLNISV
jgi:hypothetical protein